MKEEQQQGYQMPPEYYGMGAIGMPTTMPQINDGTYEKIIETNELIDELIMTLRGQRVNPETNKIEQQSKPIVSEDAINWVVGRLRPYTSKIFSLSILDEKVLKQIIYEFEVEITTDLMFPEKYGVERKNRSYVKWLMVHCFMATIYKAFKGETLRRLLQQHHITETTVTQQQARESFFKKMGLKF